MHIQQFVFLFKSMVACQLFLNEQCLIMQNKLTTLTRIVAATGALLLLLAIVLPVWRIELSAPQYPEGLVLQIYSHKLGGDVEVVNGLNHYIGMRPFSEETFPELHYLPWLIGALALLVWVTAWTRSRSLLMGVLALLVIGAAWGLYDLHRWLVTFGTDLDPRAPIQLEPFVPPILGENRVANFVTNSSFLSGAWLVGAAFLLLLYPLWRDRRR